MIREFFEGVEHSTSLFDIDRVQFIIGLDNKLKLLGADVTASDASCDDENGKAEEPADGADQPKATVFEPYKGKKRKSGTGYVKQLSANCWQGRYTPTINGKRIARNVYAPTEDECEVKLAELIREMKAEFGIK